MNGTSMIARLLALFIPRQEGGDGDGDEGKPTDDRPDYIQEKFWEPESKTVRVETMAKSLTELEGKLRSNKEDLTKEINEERLKGVPEKYVVTLPTGDDVPEGIELTLKEDDPLVTWFSGFAKEIGLSQETFDKAITEYVKLEIAALPNPEDEVKALGDYGSDRMLKVNKFLEDKLDAEGYAALLPMVGNAAAVKAIEQLMKTSGPGEFHADGGGDKPLTRDELRAMQKDPRYWREKDPAYIKKVQDAYDRSFPGKADLSGAT